MNYNKLKIFYEVSKTLNLTKTAEQLYLSQSALSRHISDLEKELSTTLFTRTNRNLILTNAGKVLQEECQRIFPDEAVLLQKVRNAAYLNTNQNLNIGFMGIKGAFYVPEVVNSLIQEHQHLTLSMTRLNWGNITKALTHGTIDVALRLRIEEDQENILAYHVLDAAPLSIILPKTHPLAQKQSAQLSDFKQEAFLMLSKQGSMTPYDYTLNYCKKNGFIPKIAATYDQAETILMMIRAKGGISLLSNLAASEPFPDLTSVSLIDSPRILLELAWQKKSTNSNIRLFVEKYTDYYRMHS